MCAGAGFLLAVLWFDLMFDVQLLAAGTEVPERVLASIASYYARVTSAARPMNRLVALAMAGTLAAVALEIANADYEPWLRWVSLALVLAPVLIAGTRTVPSAVRLGTRRDAASAQSRIARAILREHMFCFGCIAALLGLQLSA